MCDGTLFRRYNVVRTRATSRSNGELVVFEAGSGVGTDYSNMECVAISGCGCRARTFFFLPYERVHKVPARIGRRRLQMRGNQFPELLENALLVALPLSLDSRFAFASLRE